MPHDKLSLSTNFVQITDNRQKNLLTTNNRQRPTINRQATYHGAPFIQTLQRQGTSKSKIYVCEGYLISLIFSPQIKFLVVRRANFIILDNFSLSRIGKATILVSLHATLYINKLKTPAFQHPVIRAEGLKHSQL